MKDEKTKYEKSSGNVFADLGLPEPEDRIAKAELARNISSIISRRKLTQKAAAELLSIDQPKVSALLRGKLAGFSLERLIRFLNVLGRDVEIMVKPKPSRRAHAKFSVAS